MASFLVDECVPRAVYEALLASGHQIALVRDLATGASDEDIVQLAHSRGLALITEDRRFGFIAINAKAPSNGVIILALPSATPAEKARRVGALGASILETLCGSVMVVGPNSVRRRPL